MLEKKRNSGQVAMIVLLIMAVTLVISLSLAKSTTTEIAQTAQRAETTRIFSEAESGTEMILTNLITAMRAGDEATISDLVNGGTSNISDILLGGPTPPSASDRSLMNYAVDASTELEISLAAGESTEYWFMDATGAPAEDPAGVSVDYRWAVRGQPCGEQASLIIARYYLAGTEVKTEFTALNPFCGGPSNNFDSANAGDAEYENSYSLTYGEFDLFVRVIPVYHPTQLKIDGGSVDQQYAVRTESMNLVGEDQETQAVAATSTVLHLPSYMDYAVYSGVDLVK